MPRKREPQGDFDVQINAELIHDLLIACLTKNGLLGDGNNPISRWPIMLFNELKKNKEVASLIKREDYDNYLRDIYNKALKWIRMNQGSTPYGIGYLNILPLLTYLDKKDLINIEPRVSSDTSSTAVVQPRKIPVIYTPKAYGLFSILRNPESGFIYFYPGGDCVFEGETHLYFKAAELISADLHSMYADEEYWIILKYEKKTLQQTAYFAQIISENGCSKLINPHILLDLFRKQISNP